MYILSAYEVNIWQWLAVMMEIYFMPFKYCNFGDFPTNLLVHRVLFLRQSPYRLTLIFMYIHVSTIEGLVLVCRGEIITNKMFSWTLQKLSHTNKNWLTGTVIYVPVYLEIVLSSCKAVLLCYSIKYQPSSVWRSHYLVSPSRRPSLPPLYRSCGHSRSLHCRRSVLTWLLPVILSLSRQQVWEWQQQAYLKPGHIINTQC